jgi:hypothetical protein
VKIASAFAWGGLVAWVFAILGAAIDGQAPPSHVFGAIAAIATLVTWFTAWIHAILSRRFGWAIGTLLVWPAAFAYVLAPGLAKVDA